MMDDIQLLYNKIDILYNKQNEIILKMNQIISKMNNVPDDLIKDFKHLNKKVIWMEYEMNRLKNKTRLTDEDL